MEVWRPLGLRLSPWMVPAFGLAVLTLMPSQEG